MANATKRLNKVARELGVGVSTIAAFLQENGHDVEAKPNTKIDDNQYNLLLEEYQSDKQAKDKSKELSKNRMVKETITIEDKSESGSGRKDDDDEVVIKNMTVDPVVDLKERLEQKKKEKEEAAKRAEESKKGDDSSDKDVESSEEKGDESSTEPRVVGKIDLDSMNLKSRPTRQSKKKADEEKKETESKKKAEEKAAAEAEEKKKREASEKKEAESKKKAEEKAAEEEKSKKAEESARPERIETKVEKLQGPNFTGDKIDLSQFEKKKKKPVASSNENTEIKKVKKKKRRRISEDKKGRRGAPAGKRGQQDPNEPSAEEIQKEIKDTLARLQGGGKSKSAKYRKAKRDAVSEQQEEEQQRQEEEQKVLKVTEFVTATELASLMNVSVNEVISSFMSLGMMVSINQRLDAETMTIVAEEFG